MEGEDFGGWLVPAKEADSFEYLWNSDMEGLFHSTPKGAKFTFAVWENQDGKISVEFKNFE